MVFVNGLAGCEMKTYRVSAVSTGSSRKPDFPKICAICGSRKAEDLVSILINDEESRVDFYFYKFPVSPASGPLLEIPVHDSCARAFRNHFLKRLALSVLGAAAIVAIGIFSSFSFWISIIAAVIMALLFLGPEISKPAPVEFGRSMDGKYALWFKDASYAREFARMNGVEMKETRYH